MHRAISNHYKAAIRIVLIGLLLCPHVACAQLSALVPGERIRVVAPTISNRAVVGTLMAPIGDTVHVAAPVRNARPDSAGAIVRYAIPVFIIRRLDHRKSGLRLTGAGRGIKVAAASMLGLTAGCALELEEDQGFCFAFGIVVALPVVSLVGGVIGALFGAEGWRTVHP